MLLINAWLTVERLFPASCNTQKNMRNDQKPRCSSSMVTAIPQFENFAIPSYHTPKLKNIVILAITFSPLISIFYHLATWNFFELIIQLKFWNYVSITITMLYTLNILCPWAIVSITRLQQLSPPSPNRLSPGLLFYK